MNPKGNNMNHISDFSKFIPSDLFKEEEEEESNDSDSDNKNNSFNNYILEEQEPEPKDTYFPNLNSFDSEPPKDTKPSTRYSDSHILDHYKLSFQMGVPFCQTQYQGNLYQSFSHNPMINQSYIHYSPQLHHQMNKPYGFDYQHQHQHQQEMQRQIMQNKLSNSYFEQMNIGLQPMSYQSNDSLNHLNDNTFVQCEKELHSPLYKQKFNSSNNISTHNTHATTNKKSKNVNKRNRSSLFVNNSENKAECDIRDFKRFCDGLKCELEVYICSQIGSRIMQKYLAKFPPDIVTLLINKLNLFIPKIMIDKYGNYFCKRLIEIASKGQRVLILKSIESSFSIISKESTGTHVLQTLIKIIDSNEEETIILKAIRQHELEMAYDINATHVLQKILMAIDESKRILLNNILLDNFKELCLNSKGICVIKKLISTSLSSETRISISKKLSENFLDIAESPYGNYSIQYIIEDWGIENNPEILQLIIENIVPLSIHKFSSNIIEKYISHSPKENQDLIIKELFNSNSINVLITSKYGKFILTKCISLMDKDKIASIKNELTEEIQDNSTKGKNRLKTIINMFNGDNSLD